MSFLITFTDTSTPGPSGPITAWSWAFGDGGTSTLENPTHSYASAGTYSVTLTVTGSGSDGTAQVVQPITVIDTTLLRANFTVSISGLAVTFTDTSNPGPSGPITAWSWDFGDTGTSTLQNPTHTYAASGTYTVSLVVTGTGADGTAITTSPIGVSNTGGGTGGNGLNFTLGFNTPVVACSDDFAGSLGTKPDSNKWAFKSFTSGSSGCKFNGSSNCQLDGSGHLDMFATWSGSQWLSTFITSKGSYTGEHYIETKAQVPSDIGTWSAPAWEWDSPYGSGGFENDVIEQLGGNQSQSYHTTMHDPSSNQASFNNATGVTLSGGYHIYSCAVYTTHADFYFDGTLVKTITPSMLSGAWDFTNRAFVVNADLNIGGWAGAPNNTNTKHLLIDYIKVWTR